MRFEDEYNENIFANGATYLGQSFNTNIGSEAEAFNNICNNTYNNTYDDYQFNLQGRSSAIYLDQCKYF
jgi:hypothetical protein